MKAITLKSLVPVYLHPSTHVSVDLFIRLVLIVRKLDHIRMITV